MSFNRTTQPSSFYGHHRPRRTQLTFPRQSTPRTRKFDKDSGLVYTEGHILASASSLDWTGNYQTPSLVKPRLPNAVGAASLLDSAKAVLARHMRWLTKDHLDAIPWIIASKLWDEIVSSRTESFHAWKMFATAYPEEFGSDRGKRCCMKIPAPGLPLADYYAGLNDSRIGTYLIALRISPRETTVPDLVRLSGIQNLVVLDLTDRSPSILDEHPLSTFDERIVRAWAETTSSTSGKPAFQTLRAILLGRQHEVGPWLFKYLPRFPKLGRVVLTDCAGLHQKNRCEWGEVAGETGWRARSAKKSARRVRSVIDRINHGDGDKEQKEPSGGFGSVAAVLDVEGEEEAALFTGQTQEKKPLVECWLGQLSTWTHIVDEYPGTRTVWLDRISDPSTDDCPTSVTAINAEYAVKVLENHNLLEHQTSPLPDRTKRSRDHELDTDSSRLSQSPQRPRTKKPTPPNAPKSKLALGPRMKKRLPAKGQNLEDVLKGFS